MKRTCTILVIAAVLLALPFWGMLVVGYPLRWAFELLHGSLLINAIITPIVYRMRQGAWYDRRGEWQEGIPEPLMVYDLSEETSTTWEGSPEDLYTQPCPGGTCVKPYLEPFYAGSGQEFFSGHYSAVLPSPNGRWHALVAWHIYGPEDLVLIGNN